MYLAGRVKKPKHCQDEIEHFQNTPLKEELEGLTDTFWIFTIRKEFEILLLEENFVADLYFMFWQRFNDI